MIYRILKKAVLAAALLPFASCITDPQVIGPVSPVAEGEVSLALHTRAPLFELPATRTGTAIEDVSDSHPLWVLVFEGTGDGAAFVEAAQADRTHGDPHVTLMSRSAAKTYTVLILANVAGPFSITAGTTFSAACESLLMAELSSPQPTVPYAGGALPMSGTCEVAGIDSATSLGTDGDPVDLTRSVAKIVVVNTAPEFNLAGATVSNAPRRGTLHRPEEKPIRANTGNQTDYRNGNATTDTAAGIAAAAPPDDPEAGTGILQTTVKNPIYVYESPAAEGTSVIVQGTYTDSDGNVFEGYYKLALRSAYGGDPLPVERNHNYTVTIGAVNRPGFASLAEAIASEHPSNEDITWSVEVADDSGHEIVDNGEYYLAVSNSEYIIYADGEPSGLTAVTVTTDANAHGQKYKVTAAASGGIATANTNTNGELSPDSSADGVAVYNVKINIGEGFTEGGVLTVRVGNLVKRITVSREPAIAGALPFIIFGDTGDKFIAAEVTGGTGWLKVSPTIDDRKAATRLNQAPTQTGEIYIHPAAYIGDGTDTPKTDGTVYLSREKNNPTGARVKVDIHQRQAKIEVPVTHNTRIGETGTPLAAPYIGTFHRWNETGERLLRVPVFNGTESTTHGGQTYTTTANNSGKWRAEVVDGTEFILLDNQYPSTFPVNTTSAENSQLGAGAQLWVDGQTATTGHTEFKFRLGLKDKLTAKGSQPRYGRVMVSYRDHNNVYYIHVRQGEEPDYVIPLSKRSESEGNIRFTVYNLAPKGDMNGKGSTFSYKLSLTDPPIYADEIASDFTDYPTKAGAQFQFASPDADDYNTANDTDFRRYAFNPTSYKQSFLTSTSSGLPNDATWPRWTNGDFHDDFTSSNRPVRETCPTGFRRPMAGLENNSVQEFKNSLFADDAGSNSAWGYYADGYFDRRQLATQSASGDNTTEFGSVQTSSGDSNSGSWVVAHIGRLFYNNEEDGNHASIFFPGAGFRHHKGYLLWPGYGYYWSSEASDTQTSETTGGVTETYYQGFWMRFQGGTMYKAVSGDSKGVRSSGANIRCVACPPVSVTGATVSASWDGSRWIVSPSSIPGAVQYHWEYSYSSNSGGTWSAWTDFPGRHATGFWLHTTGGNSRYTPNMGNGQYKFRMTVLNICGAQPVESPVYTHPAP
jgi:hypothetical protein